ncbi:MAX gene-associated protein [Antennarius striatus]|uniref:MAX gene-associated protein n=1 Tax=Antennarius striatus TaxID=241820 RepID=UPI0035ADF446
MMPATDAEAALMEDPQALEDKEVSLNGLSSVPPIPSPSSIPLVPTPTRPNFTSETMIETRAVSMASNDCSSSVASPAEASPAKPAVTPVTIDGTAETTPATSHIASASDSLGCTGTTLVSVSESSPLWPELPSTTFGGPDPETDSPNVLIFNGVSVTLENNNMWKQFHSCGTEMILTKQGRRMFPYCRYRLAGLDPDRKYSLVLSITPSDHYRYRWNMPKWEISGPAENQTQGLMRAFSHHHSPCRGSEWMSSLVSFYKLKLTNNSQDQDGQILLHSMHRYIPRLHVIPVPDGQEAGKPLVNWLESITFTFPQTEFMAVTTYQNFRITQLKINHNPFAKGFREDGNNSRLNRVSTLPPPETETMETEPSPLEPEEIKEEAVDLSMKRTTSAPAPLSTEQETRIILKPIMSSPGGGDESYVPCIGGKHALGELVLVQKRPRLEPEGEPQPVSDVRKERKTPTDMSVSPASTTSTPRSLRGYRKKRKRINRRWANSRGKVWKAAKASQAVLHCPSSSVPMQDDVEGLLFLSFSSKEALEFHVSDNPDKNTSPAAPETTQMRVNHKVEEIREMEEEKIARVEAVLLQDFQVLKHRQVIHPALQQVGLKLSSLDPTKSVDLQYLGVLLSLPPMELPQQGHATSPNGGLPFVSRTGKTSDVTKIKGWKNKFVRSKETSPSNGDGPEKNLSAFCSNMLDEYLESEGQYISERAAAFSTSPEGPVAYQLPTRSSSYVKTLDSVLKKNAASKGPTRTNRPCPLSHKRPSSSSSNAMTSTAPPPARSIQTSASPHIQSEAALIGNIAAGSVSSSSVTLRLLTPEARRPLISGLSHGPTHKPTGFTKAQLKLLEMESGAMNTGLNRTNLTPERLEVALSAILSKKMLPSQFMKVPQYPSCKAEQPDCGKDSCRLGCVCSSLLHLNSGPLHCRQPECMFGCACFKRRNAEPLSAGKSGQQIQPASSLANLDRAVQPCPWSRVHRLWNCKADEDPEPLFAPKSAVVCSVPAKTVRRSTKSHPPSMIREEDKDPVYKYLESKMTCARVREFNSKPPPEVTLELVPKTPQKQANMTADSHQRMFHTVWSLKQAAGGASQATTVSETQVRKQIEIQSTCQWSKDRKKIQDTLGRRLNQDRLDRRFCIGPYCINPLAKIVMKKPSDSVITYRIHISKVSKSTDNEESDDTNKADLNTEEEGSQIENSNIIPGVTPFLRGILPSGILRTMTKPAGCQEARGLIQVNGKSYNHAKLLLGSMGSLHPANRLAAYVTGRLPVSAGLCLKTSQKPDTADKINASGTLHIKAAGTVVPTAKPERKTTEQKTPAHPPVQASQPDSLRKVCITVKQQSQSPPTVSPAKPFVSGQGKIVCPFQTSFTTSNISLIVSPSLKTPSFLEKNDTYSFRIFPPANNVPTGPNPPGVILPGGFTLIQLPKNGDGGVTQPSGNTGHVAVVDKDSPPEGGLCKADHLSADSDANCEGLDTSTRGEDRLSSSSVESGSSPALTCNETLEENNKDIRKVDSSPDSSSEDLSSDSSDSCEEDDEDEDLVDVENVKEGEQGMAIIKMKEDLKALGESCNALESTRKLSEDQKRNEHSLDKEKKRRSSHTVLERQRRSAQRHLFNNLQLVLQSNPNAARLRVLALAQSEIKNLVDTCKFLEEQKNRLMHIQSVYVDRLSVLTGKSVAAIKVKLMEIYDKQKMREKSRKWVPFYSRLLQSRAALLADANPESDPQPRHTPLLQTDPCRDTFPPNTHTITAQNSVEQTPKPPDTHIPAHEEGTAPSLEITNEPGGPEAPAKESMSNSQIESDPPAPSVVEPEVTTAQDTHLPEFMELPKAPPIQPHLTVALPLVRSKDGRIILPSSVKPNSQGLYTLMVVNPKQKREKTEADMQPPDVDQQMNLVNSDRPTESSHVSDEEKTVAFPNSRQILSDKNSALARLVQLNKSLSAPSPVLDCTLKTQEGTVVGLKKSASQSFNNMSEVPTSIDAKPNGSPTVAHRARGRPRKHPISKNGRSAVVRDSRKRVSDSDTSLVAGEDQRQATRGANTECPVPVKRGRGRPPKKKHGESPNQFKYEEDISFRLPKHLESTDNKLTPNLTSTPKAGEGKASRPLTRGSLGKDFPSEKKRSWIDVEKTLEPDFDSDYSS